jgi:hypothetical protein
VTVEGKIERNSGQEFLGKRETGIILPDITSLTHDIANNSQTSNKQDETPFFFISGFQ